MYSIHSVIWAPLWEGPAGPEPRSRDSNTGRTDLVAWMLTTRPTHLPVDTEEKCWRIFQRFLRHLGLSFAPKPRLNKVIVYLIIAKFRLYVLYNSCHVLKGQLYPDPDPDVQNCKTQGFRIFVLIKNSLIKNRPHYQKLGLLGTS